MYICRDLYTIPSNICACDTNLFLFSYLSTFLAMFVLNNMNILNHTQEYYLYEKSAQDSS